MEPVDVAYNISSCGYFAREADGRTGLDVNFARPWDNCLLDTCGEIK